MVYIVFIVWFASFLILLNYKELGLAFHLLFLPTLTFSVRSLDWFLSEGGRWLSVAEVGDSCCWYMCSMDIPVSGITVPCMFLAHFKTSNVNQQVHSARPVPSKQAHLAYDVIKVVYQQACPGFTCLNQRVLWRHNDSQLYKFRQFIGGAHYRFGISTELSGSSPPKIGLDTPMHTGL